MSPLQRHLLQFAGAVVALALVVGGLVGGGVLLLAKAAGMPQRFGPATAQGSAGSLASPLPTKALPVPNGNASSSTPQQSSPSSNRATRLPRPHGSITLTSTSNHVSPSGRIYLTGSWPGHSGVSLSIENSDGGAFTSFSGLTVPVSGGTFTTYVMTSRSGVARFRVKDPRTGTTSNVVRVSVG